MQEVKNNFICVKKKKMQIYVRLMVVIILLCQQNCVILPKTRGHIYLRTRANTAEKYSHRGVHFILHSRTR